MLCSSVERQKRWTTSQQDSCCLHQGWYSFSPPAVNSQGSSPVGSHEPALHQISLYPRQTELNCSSDVKRGLLQSEWKRNPTLNSAVVRQVQESRGGPVCILQKCTVRSVVLSVHTERSSTRSGHFLLTPVAQSSPLCLPSSSPDPTSLGGH